MKDVITRHIHRLAQALLLSLYCCMVAAVQVEAQSASPGPPTQGIASLVQVPRNLSEMLHNIKIAMDYGLPLVDAFYSNDVLNHYFGSRKLAWAWNDAKNGKRVEAADFDNFVQPLHVAGVLVGGLTVLLVETLGAAGADTASILVNVAGQSNTKFDDIEQIFGSGWTRPPPPLQPPHRNSYSPPTHPLGNGTIGYCFRDSPHGWCARFEFRSDGTLRLAEFATEGSINK